MRAGEVATTAPVGVETHDDPRVVCYVRSTVPGPVVETVDAAVTRLEQLHEEGSIASYRITDWPPERHAVTEAAGEPTREDLVGAFERWAAERGCSLEPAFRRLERPRSPFGRDDDVLERVRVPLLALAVYDGPTAGEPTAAGPGNEGATSADLEAVFPHTTRPETGEQRTHTVFEWLRGSDRDRRPGTGALGSDGFTPLEGCQ